MVLCRILCSIRIVQSNVYKVPEAHFSLTPEAVYLLSREREREEEIPSKEHSLAHFACLLGEQGSQH